MQTMKMRGHFLETYNGDFCAAIAKDLVPKKIVLLLDYTEKDKFMNVATNLAGANTKTTISRHGSDILISLTIDALVTCSLDEKAATLNDLLGKEIICDIKITRYSLTSKFEKNRGEKIVGVSTKLKAATAF